MPGLFVVMTRSASIDAAATSARGGYKRYLHGIIERTDAPHENAGLKETSGKKTARRLYRISSPAANLQKPPPARLDLHDGRRCGYVRQPGLHIGQRRGRYACMLGRKAQPRLVSVIIVSVET